MILLCEHDLELVSMDLLNGKMVTQCKMCNVTFGYSGVEVTKYKEEYSDPSSTIVLEHTFTIKGGDQNI